MAYLGWLLATLLLMLPARKKPARASSNLRQRMSSVPVYRGLTYWEVQKIARAAPTSITPRGDEIIRRWVSGNYQIALRFNRHDVCLGVEEEIDR